MIISMSKNDVNQNQNESGWQPNWSLVAAAPPPENVTVMTKIDDKYGCRNVQALKKQGNLWFIPDGSMYVYYTPTHWAPQHQE